jgi:mxaC protein
MTILFSRPWCLLLLLPTVLPWVRSATTPFGYSWLGLLPSDPPSEALDAVLKVLATIALGGCALGLAGPYSMSPPLERVGRGAQVVLLLDRSRSMDEPFAGAAVSGAIASERASAGHESKGAAARRQLAQFAQHREHDLVGMLDFSTVPIPIIGFTNRPDMVEAAIQAGNEGRGLADTDVGLGLLAALSQFEHQPYNGSRVILLVSDGGARLDPDMQRRIAASMKRERVALYWLYLRTNRSPGLLAADTDALAVSQDQAPEQLLHQFFSSMGTPYHAYEAEDPHALQHAIDDVDRLERLPIRYQLAAPRHDLAGTAYGTALGCVTLLLGASLLEARRWH